MVALEYHCGEDKVPSRLNAMTMRVGPIGGGAVLVGFLKKALLLQLVAS
jgi:hypothetical protein